MISREQIQNLKVGDYVRWTYDTKDGVPTPNAYWHDWEKVTRIFARGETMTGERKGKAYVCFYHEWGLPRRSEMSMSVGEDEQFAELASAREIEASKLDEEYER